MTIPKIQKSDWEVELEHIGKEANTSEDQSQDHIAGYCGQRLRKGISTRACWTVG